MIAKKSFDIFGEKASIEIHKSEKLINGFKLIGRIAKKEYMTADIIPESQLVSTSYSMETQMRSAVFASIFQANYLAKDKMKVIGFHYESESPKPKKPHVAPKDG